MGFMPKNQFINYWLFYMAVIFLLILELSGYFPFYSYLVRYPTDWFFNLFGRWPCCFMNIVSILFGLIFPFLLVILLWRMFINRKILSLIVMMGTVLTGVIGILIYFLLFEFSNWKGHIFWLLVLGLYLFLYLIVIKMDEKFKYIKFWLGTLGLYVFPLITGYAVYILAVSPRFGINPFFSPTRISLTFLTPISGIPFYFIVKKYINSKKLLIYFSATSLLFLAGIFLMGALITEFFPYQVCIFPGSEHVDKAKLNVYSYQGKVPINKANAILIAQNKIIRLGYQYDPKCLKAELMTFPPKTDPKIC